MQILSNIMIESLISKRLKYLLSWSIVMEEIYSSSLEGVVNHLIILEKISYGRFLLKLSVHCIIVIVGLRLLKLIMEQIRT